MAIGKTVSRAVAKSAKKIKFNPAAGMKGFPPNVRTRNINGALRRARGDKLLGTIRKQFDMSAEALAGHSDRMQLGTLRKMRGVDSQKDILRGIFGLKGGRSVNINGKIRGKRADTLLSTVRKQYGRSPESFAGHSGRMHLGTLQEKRGVSSVSDILNNVFGLKGGRSVNANGKIRAKRADTLLGTVRKNRGLGKASFAGHSDRMQLGTLEAKRGVFTQNEILAGEHGFKGAGKGGRVRTKGGQVRAKRGDTLARTLEKQYGVEFPGRNDKHLETIRKESGQQGIKDILNWARGK